MAFDGLVTYTIVKELQNHLINGKIDKIFEPNSNELLLGVYSNGTKYALNIVVSSNNYRICVTNSAKPNPPFAPNFCMVLRKYLLNTKIVDISMQSLERIVTIGFEGYDKLGNFENKKLIIELMGKHSNVILLNSNNVIIDALKHFHIEDNSYRNILPNYKYVLPISNKLDIMQIQSKEDFYQKTLDYINHDEKTDRHNLKCITTSSNLSDIIANTYTGISKSTMLSIIQQLNINNIFTKDNLDKVYLFLMNILQNSSHTILQLVSEHDYSPFIEKHDKIDILQSNFFVDEYYSKKETSENFITYRNNLSKLILNYMKKLNHKLSNINQKLEECKDTELYRLYGELITTNSYRIKDSHLEEIQIENYYDNNNIITIPLDKTISPAMNAKNYFKKYHKLKNAKIIVEEQKKEVENEINYLESIIYEFQSANTITDIDSVYSEFSENFLDNDTHYNKQKKKTKSNKKTSKKKARIEAQIGEPMQYKIDGYAIIIGKNNKQNDYITKHARPNDIWFHTKDIHGSHVILKVENESNKPSQDIINQVAALTAFYSKARESSNVSVDYTYAKYVKKPSGAKPGMVIYTNYKNVIVKPNLYLKILNS